MNTDKILVWDLPTRVFHWLLATSFVGAFVTAESEHFRDVHVVLGYTVAGLIGFRLLWGMIGTRYANFRSFVFGPRAVLEYLISLFTRTPELYVGHNPVGSWAIWTLLALGLLSAGSGYAVYSDLGGEWLEEVHEALSNTMLAVVAVHIAGVLLSSLLHRENLVSAMITGYKHGVQAEAVHRTHWIAGILLAASVGAYWAGVF
ncbi:MAG: cytochrome B [Acidithiobacillales bacterium SM23_46]|jgi:cytochrome b|nr:MAG: cytochrome B [Thiotrichales bacterium SG8_50]KPK68650.1 MAG: cytochrome B [Acidithiobacillales bacterium SM23_46]KPL27051.1 MAG: cytochrome B [Acidithiobacillales bacterium SM1_46]